MSSESFAAQCARLASGLSAKARKRLGEYLRSSYRPAAVQAGHEEAELSALGLIRRLDPTPLSRLPLYCITPLGEAVCAQVHKLNRQRRLPHDALATDLAGWLRRHCGMWAWENVELPTRMEGQLALVWARPDVLAIPATVLESPAASIYEVKRSRSDLLGDIANPSKRQAYLSLAGAVYYATAPGIAKAEDIPAECGWVEHRPPLDWKVHKKAPRQHRRGLSGEALVALAANQQISSK